MVGRGEGWVLEAVGLLTGWPSEEERTGLDGAGLGWAGQDEELCGSKGSWQDDCQLSSREVPSGEAQGPALHPVWASGSG